MSKWVPGVVCLAVLIGCGGGGSHPTGSGGSSNGGSGARCVPGDSKSCTGPGPCSGYQVCQGDGTYGACNCGGTGGIAGGTGGTGGSAGSTTGIGGRGGAGGSAAGTGGSAGAGGAINCTVDAAAGDDAPQTAPEAGRDAYVSDGPSSAAAFQSFCAGVRSSIVARNERCNGFTPAQAAAFVIVDPCGAWGGALDKGYMSFDATNADACVTALGALSCAADVPPAACDGVLTGLVANYTGLGGPYAACSPATQLTLTGPTTPATASLFTECLPGSFCNAHDLGPPFVCLPLPKLGEVCVAGVSQPPLNHLQGRCATGVCDHTGHCATPKAAGDACTTGADCAPELYCASSSTCAAKHATGSCASSTECVRPATCNNGSCGVRPRGGCCASVSDCAINEDCPPRGGNCFAAPVIGQTCGETMPICLTGICNGTTKVCQPGSLGGACAGDPWCGPDALCLPIAGSTPVCGPVAY